MIEYFLERYGSISRTNLYGRLLVVLIFMFVIQIFSSEPTFILGEAYQGAKVGGMLVALLYLFMLWIMVLIVHTLGKRGFIIQILWFYGIMAFFLIFYVSNPFIDALPDHHKPLVFTACHIGNVFVQAYFIYVVLENIFASNKTRPDHIWGAVCVYFYGILLFAEIYEILCLWNAGLLGEVYEMGWPNFVQCVIFSLSSVVGAELNYPEAHSLLTKLGALENIIGSLFLVVILGRLLSFPLQKEA